MSTLFPYKWGSRIGQGAFGRVMRVRKEGEIDVKAAKIFSDASQSNQRQYEILRLFNGSLDIVQSFEFYPAVLLEGENIPRSIMVMEWAKGGSLYNLLATYHNNLGNVDWKEGKWRPSLSCCRTYFGMMVRGLETIHNLQFCHRDFKVDNLAMDSAGFLKIIDFGMAAPCNQQTRFNDTYGTAAYMAPECHMGNYNGIKADMFALGVSLFYLYFMEFPFGRPDEKCQSRQDYFQRVYMRYYRTFVQHNDRFWETKKFHAGDEREDLISLLNALLAPQAKRNISMKGVRQTEWFKVPKLTNSELACMFDRLANFNLPAGKNPFTPTMKVSCVQQFSTRSSKEPFEEYLNGIKIDASKLQTVKELNYSSILFAGSPEALVAALRYILEGTGKEYVGALGASYERYEVTISETQPAKITIHAKIQKENEVIDGQLDVFMALDEEDNVVVDMFAKEDTLDMAEFGTLRSFIIQRLQSLV